MPRKWTPDEKRKQATAILQWQPWRHSTGPRSTKGKEVSKNNARKHGVHSASIRKLRKVLRDQIKWLRGF